MNTDKFKHDSDCFYEAMGLTEDQYDEIMFKVMQIIDRHADSKQSVRAAACMKWAYDKFDEDETRLTAIFMMGQAIEKATMMASMHEIVSKRGGMLDQLIKSKMGKDADDTITANFDNEDMAKDFMKEFKALIAEYDGEEVKDFGGPDSGVMAIKLDPDNKEEFYEKLYVLRKKYGIEMSEGDSELPFTMPFGGPIAEA